MKVALSGNKKAIYVNALHFELLQLNLLSRLLSEKAKNVYEDSV